MQKVPDCKQAEEYQTNRNGDNDAVKYSKRVCFNKKLRAKSVAKQSNFGCLLLAIFTYLINKYLVMVRFLVQMTKSPRYTQSKASMNRAAMQ